jgi:transposase
MKQVDTIRKAQAQRRRRRQHSAQFKARVVQACALPGAAVAAVALEYGVDASVLRRWLKSSAHSKAAAVAVASKPTAASRRSEFVPVLVEAPIPSAQQIRIEVRRGATAVNIEWPTQAARECAAWLREWLR